MIYSLTFVLVVADFARGVWNTPSGSLTLLTLFLILGWTLDIGGRTDIDKELLVSFGIVFGLDFRFQAEAGFGLDELHVLGELAVLFELLEVLVVFLGRLGMWEKRYGFIFGI